MKCPICSLEMEDGIIEAGASILNLSDNDTLYLYKICMS